MIFRPPPVWDYLEGMFVKNMLAQLQGYKAWTAMAEILSKGTSCDPLITEQLRLKGTYGGPFVQHPRSSKTMQSPLPRLCPESFWVSARSEILPLLQATSVSEKWSRRTDILQTPNSWRNCSEVTSNQCCFQSYCDVLVYWTVHSTTQEKATFGGYGEGIQWHLAKLTAKKLLWDALFPQNSLTEGKAPKEAFSP